MGILHTANERLLGERVKILVRRAKQKIEIFDTSLNCRFGGLIMMFRLIKYGTSQMICC